MKGPQIGTGGLLLALLLNSCASVLVHDAQIRPVDFDPLELTPMINENFIRIDLMRQTDATTSKSTSTTSQAPGVNRTTTTTSTTTNKAPYHPLVLHLGNGLYIDMAFNIFFDPRDISGVRSFNRISGDKIQYSVSNNLHSNLDARVFSVDYYFLRKDETLYASNKDGEEKRLLVELRNGTYYCNEYNILGIHVYDYALMKDADANRYTYKTTTKTLISSNYAFSLENGAVMLDEGDSLFGPDIITITQNANRIIIANKNRVLMDILRYDQGYIIRYSERYGKLIKVEEGRISVTECTEPTLTQTFFGGNKTDSTIVVE